MTQPPAGRYVGPSAPARSDAPVSSADGVPAGSSAVSADAPTTTLPVPQWESPAPSAQPAFTSTPLVQGTRVSGGAPAGPANSGGAGATAAAATVLRPGQAADGGDGAPAAGGTHSSRPSRARGPRRARLQLRHIDPWTVLKFSCVLAIALFFVWLIVIGVLFGVLDGAGIIHKINDTVTTLQSGNAQPPITAKVVFGGAAIIGVVNIVLFIALTTVGAVVYNLCADLVGGIEITLSER